MNAVIQPELKAAHERRFAGVSDYRTQVWAVLTRDFF
jgi:hypothetical protein